MTKRILLFFAILLTGFATHTTFAQSASSSNKKAIKAYEEANELLKRRNFEGGIEKLQAALKRDPAFAEAHLLLGNTYQFLLEKEQATPYYQAYVQLIPESKAAYELYPRLGDAKMLQAKYDTARIYYEKALQSKTLKPADVERINKRIQSTEFAREALKNPLPVKPEPLSPTVNRFQLQYFPVLTADQKTLIYTGMDGMGREHNEDIYISRLEGGEWTEPEPISPNINTQLNEGTCSISADGRTLVFTNCDQGKGFGRCDLYISRKTGSEWSKPQNLGAGVNSRSWESQPALSADGRTLYFTSDRPGGQGGHDIWISTMDEKGVWQKAENLGPTINTADNEQAPFLHANGQTLYFASNGHVGMGGMDLYYSNLRGEEWAEPVNLGYPINTYLDQVGLFITTDGTKGYYSLEKRLSRQDMSSVIYSFDVPQSLRPEQKTGFVRGKVYDETTNKALSAAVELIDLRSGKPLQVVSADSATGEYLIVLTEGSKYALYVNKPGYLFKSLNFDYTAGKEASALTRDIPLNPIKANTKTTLNNIFFESGKWELLNESKTELNKVVSFLKANPGVKIEIEGHTDDVGGDKDNLQLSRQRAMAVYEYLVKQQVAKERLLYKGYGKAQPVVPNSSDENRQLNRRIEFRIL
jgi:OmpA-OmpF porin, OOP family